MPYLLRSNEMRDSHPKTLTAGMKAHAARLKKGAQGCLLIREYKHFGRLVLNADGQRVWHRKIVEHYYEAETHRARKRTT